VSLSLLFVVLAVGVVLVGARVAAAPVSGGRVAAFARRHRIELAANESQVVAYLSHTRRWRTAGAVGACLVVLASGLRQERVAVEFFPVLAGWFLGAVIAEFRFPATAGLGLKGRDAVPGWLPRVPQILAAAALAVTVLVLALHRADGRVLGWFAGALACAAAMAAVDRHVSRRPMGGAVAAHGLGAITGAGCALVVWCLANEVSVLGDRFFDSAATAVSGIALLWTFGGLVVAGLLAAAVWRGESAAVWRGESAAVLRGGAAAAWWGEAARSMLGRAVVAVAVLVVASAGWAGYAWWNDRPPYPAGAVRATAAMRFTSYTAFEQDARAMGITGLQGLLDQPDTQEFIGRVDHVVPAGAGGGGTLHVLVVDKGQNLVAPELYDAEGGGWNGFMSSLADRYSWLSATAADLTSGGYISRGAEVTRAANSPDPISFIGRFPGTVEMSDLMIVLVLSGPDNQIYWATRVSAR
jgi:hypothetical protein